MTRAALFALLVALTACDAGQVSLESGATADSTSFVVAEAVPATLTFDRSWSESASGPVVAGGKVAIDYDEARLPNCRAWHNGNPGWQIFAYLRFAPSEQIVELPIFAYAQAPTGPDYHSWVKTIPRADVPADATGLEVWFMNGSGFDRPCTEWDSDFGRNYWFAVAPAPAEAVATMHFQADWTNVLAGQVARGGKLRISYAPERMEAIVSGQSYYFASKYHCYGYGCCSYQWSTTAHVRFNPWEEFSAHGLAGAEPLELDIPSNAGRIEVFFDADVYTTVWFCSGGEGSKSGRGPDRFYDSAYGANFVYAIP